MTVTIIGGGLAGSEAAWQLAIRGLPVDLFEMKPEVFSPAHQVPEFAELVCSNSFGSRLTDTGSGLLQREVAGLGSLIVRTALAHQIPAGRALAVDRTSFSAQVTATLSAHPLITIHREPILAIPETRPVLMCTGPLTDMRLADDLQKKIGATHLYFYDAISPIVLGESIDHSVVFSASRYEDGPGDYLNCPFNRSEYQSFVEALCAGDMYPTHDFEDMRLFHGCQPVEAMARSGLETLAFGPMRPVGLTDPRTGKRPAGVVQLRREDLAGQLWNLVGFQTRLRHGDQARIFRMIPGLADAEFVRLGSIHRNTFINAPSQLTSRMMLKALPGVYLGGQITGVEGYLESSASGLMAALYLYGDLTGVPIEAPPPETMLGGLLGYLQTANPNNFQPMNSNFGLLPPLEAPMAKKLRRGKLESRASEAFEAWRLTVPGIEVPEPEAMTG